MTSRDWDFALGDLGNPLRDIKEWMLPPYPSWLPTIIRRGQATPADYHACFNKETECAETEKPY